MGPARVFYRGVGGTQNVSMTAGRTRCIEMGVTSRAGMGHVMEKAKEGDS